MRSKLLCLAAVMPAVLSAQITVPTGPGNTQQTWFNLLNETATTRPLAEWDLAFEINGGFNVGVLVNTAKGMKVYQSPYTVADWTSVDTSGLAATWTGLQNSDTSWSHGALNQHLSGEYDLGWGVYSMITHVVVGDSVFVVKLAGGQWRKLRVDALASGAYTFTHAALDGSGEVSGSIAKADYAGKNFAYWSFDTDTAIDREPLSADWDLLFTKYLTDVGTWYGVTGVLQNKGVEVVRAAGMPPSEANDPYAIGFDPHINTIGHNWKYFDMGTMSYVIDDSLTYFVKDVPGNVWKIVFTAFGGATTGDITFTKELFSAASVHESTLAPEFAVFPNPAGAGATRIVADLNGDAAFIRLMDAGGRLVLEQRVSGRGLSTINVDLRGTPPGVYGLGLWTAAGVTTKKLVVE